MIEISQIRLPCGEDPGQLEKSIRKILRLSGGEAFSYHISRHSVDARKKPVLWDVYSVCVELANEKNPSETEEMLLKRAHSANVRAVTVVPYVFPAADAMAPILQEKPVVVGFGPAGIFCALLLARNGYRPVVFERGAPLEQRVKDVEGFWAGAPLNTQSNIQFGEGGAGTFSDGKLTSNAKDHAGRIPYIYETLLRAGSPGDIAYEQIPHIGTDRLRDVIVHIRKEILLCGGEIHFGAKVTGIVTKNGKVCGISYVQNGMKQEYAAKVVVLAPGHSARDTVRTLLGQGVSMQTKPFAVGFRISHPQSLINRSQYGISDPEEIKRLHLQAASYKVTAKAKDGRGIYSFCMCPGGYVINASSENGRLCVNGMSDYARDSARANAAIVAAVGARDFGSYHPLAGMEFQEALEQKAFETAGSKIPVQRFVSFEREEVLDIPSAGALCMKGEAAPGALHNLLPQNLRDDFICGMHVFGNKIEGFDQQEAYVIGLESRTSSPVKIVRDAGLESSIQGLFPCGEGAGYAGGIMSAALDGIRVAEQIGMRYRAQ